MMHYAQSLGKFSLELQIISLPSLYRRKRSVLIAQRTTNQARDALALSQWSEVRSVISLYKALGAGWQDEPFVQDTENPDLFETAAGL